MKAELRIVILPSGWVFVGRWHKSGQRIILTDASCIRKWGTTRGIGQLALSGPTKDTILEPAGVLSFVEGHEIAAIDCQTEWPVR